eukprot:m.66526 g.66526  ORF g.66526 m.66526 type:complete len:280 (+) comp23699_c0_seq1:172-1011(+)
MMWHVLTGKRLGLAFGLVVAVYFGNWLYFGNFHSATPSIDLPTKGYNKRKRVVVFGDSLTQNGNDPTQQGWAAGLGYYWNRKADVINRGCSGYNTQWAKQVVAEIVEIKPDLLILFFGANDAMYTKFPHAVPLEQFQANLNGFIQAIASNSAETSVILITAPPVDEAVLVARNAKEGNNRGLDRDNERTKLYADATVRLGLELNIPVVNAWAGLGGNSIERGKYLVDGLHLNSLGNQKLLELIKTTIMQHLPQWNRKALQMDYPESKTLAAQHAAQHED